LLSKAEPERPFAEPWHAQIFALTHALAAGGTFTWPEWAAHFGAALERARAAGGPVDGSDYYDVWLTALESFLVEHNFADQDRLIDLREAWTSAYLTTPHGEPVILSV
jgi:nitrile hydratase accessory protein